MAVTYEHISTITATTNTGTSFDFTSIPSTYTDLIIVGRGNSSNGNKDLTMRFNNDSGSNYSGVYMSSDALNNTTQYGITGTQTLGFVDYYGALNEYEFNTCTINILNYASTSVYKCWVGQSQSIVLLGSDLIGGQWSSTSAINRVTITSGGAATATFAKGSEYSLYGVKAA